MTAKDYKVLADAFRSILAQSSIIYLQREQFDFIMDIVCQRLRDANPRFSSRDFRAHMERP